VGQKVDVGEPFGEIESVKAVSDLYSPVEGEVVAVNQKLPDNLELLSQDPYDKGWMIRVKMSDEAGLSKLMDAKAYEKQCAQEAH
jgi:glycine cleavage system H protein